MELLEKAGKPAECVGVAVGEVDFVFFLVESKLKSKVEVVTNKGWVNVVPSHNSTPTILNFIASLVPFKALALPRHTNSHAISVKTVRLSKIADVESNLLVFHQWLVVLDAEIKPLVVACSVGVGTHVKVVFKWLHLIHPIQIATLKKRVELQFI